MTRLGWGAGTAGLVLVIVGLTARWAPLLVLGTGLFVLVVGAFVYVVRSPRLQLVRSVEPPRVEKGQPAIAVVQATNRSWRALSGLVIEQRLGETVFRAELPSLGRAETSLRTYRLPTSQRGTYSVGPVELPRADPFGLCRRVTALGEPQVISVHPRVLSLRPLPTGTSQNLEGPSSDTSPQGSVTFHRLREYVIGDDLRTVHWPSTARLGKLVVRHYVDTAQPYTVVLVDLRPEVYSPETFEEAMDVAASVATSMSWGKSPVQIRTTAGERVGGPGQRDPVPLVDFLTNVAPTPSGSLSAQLVALRRDRGSALVVVTGEIDVESLPAVASMSRFDHVIVTSLVPHSLPAPAYPGVRVFATSTAHELAQAWDGWVVRR